MTLSALHDFHTEYIVTEEEFEAISDDAVAVCMRTLEILRLYAKRAGNAKLVEQIDHDVAIVPGLLKMPACLYRTKEMNDIDLIKERTLAHERLHAYVGKRDYELWEHQRFQLKDKRRVVLGREARVVLGLNQLGPNVGHGFSLMGKRAGWSDTTPAEEALARLRELERAFEMKAHKFVYTAIRSLEALERATKKSYPKLFKIEEGDFFKAYQLIKANWGSVKAFVDSFDAVVPPGATRVS